MQHVYQLLRRCIGMCLIYSIACQNYNIIDDNGNINACDGTVTIIATVDPGTTSSFSFGWLARPNDRDITLATLAYNQGSVQVFPNEDNGFLSTNIYNFTHTFSVAGSFNSTLFISNYTITEPVGFGVGLSGSFSRTSVSTPICTVIDQFCSNCESLQILCGADFTKQCYSRNTNPIPVSCLENGTLANNEMCPVICFSSSITNASMGVEAADGVVLTEFGEIALFNCSKGYNGAPVEYNCTASGIFIPVEESLPINCSAENPVCENGINVACVLDMFSSRHTIIVRNVDVQSFSISSASEVICPTSSITDENTVVEAVGEDAAEYNETVQFRCSAGYKGTSVEYICAADGKFVPIGNSNPISCSRVTCNALQLANASAEPVNGETTIDYEDIVEFQCKESYSGMHTMYICTQSGILEPVQESGPINCVLETTISFSTTTESTDSSPMSFGVATEDTTNTSTAVTSIAAFTSENIFFAQTSVLITLSSHTLTFDNGQVGGVTTAVVCVVGLAGDFAFLLSA